VGPVGVKAGLPQRDRPVLPQIDGHHATVGQRRGAQVGQRRGLELDDLGLVNLEHRGSGRPTQPMGRRIEPGGQDHRLTDTRLGALGEELVEVSGADRHHVGHPLHAQHRSVRGARGIEFTAGQACKEMDAHGLYEGVRRTDR
jgi:hypothetical protein